MKSTKHTDKTDLPRDILQAHAEETLVSLGDVAHVHFKFTCEKCRERCILVEENNLPEYGECYECGHNTRIEKGGYLLEMSFKSGKDAVASLEKLIPKEKK